MNRFLSLLALAAFVFAGSQSATAQDRSLELRPPTIDFERFTPRISPMAVGSWDSSYGTLTVIQREDGRFIGNYSTYGRINGRLNGNKMVGTFYHPNNSGTCTTTRQGSTNWGRFEFTFARDGRSFDGKWSWCGDALDRNWDGTKM